ncbi:MAG: tetratricopeptide repeat protein [Candidatus Omnitrophota bacterium]
MLIKKSAAFLSGGILLFLLLEVFLRLPGMIMPRQGSPGDGKAANGAYRIFCIGDSFTYGMGAGYSFDYPAQLERMLNSVCRDDRFEVINHGVCSYNTAQLLSRFKAALENGDTPDLIIFLGGGSNYWNFDGRERASPFSHSRVCKLARSLFWEAKERKGGGDYRRLSENSYSPDTFYTEPEGGTLMNISIPGPKTAIPLLKERIWRGRSDSRYYAGLGVALAERGQYDEAEKCFKKGMEIYPGESICYAEMGGLCVSLGRYDEAMKWLEQALKIGPGFIEGYVNMGWLYFQQRRYAEAVGWYVKGLEIDSSSGVCYLSIGVAYARQFLYDDALAWLEKGIRSDPLNSNFYRCIAGIYRDKGDIGKAREYILKAVRLNPEDMNNWSDMFLIHGNLLKDKGYGRILSILAENDITPPKTVLEFLRKRSAANKVEQGIIRDIEDIITVCRRKRIRVILMDYPGNRRFSELMSEIARGHSIPFLSNYLVFSGFGARSGDYFAADGHCNAKGYTVIARNIFDFLKREGIFINGK